MHAGASASADLHEYTCILSPILYMQDIKG